MEIVMIFFILINRYMYMAKMERKKTNTVQLNMKFIICILSEKMISLILQKYRGTLKSIQLEQKYRQNNM